MIIMGRGFAAGSYTRAATPADIATMLAHVLHVQAPSRAVGRVLSEAFTSTNRSARPELIKSPTTE